MNPPDRGIYTKQFHFQATDSTKKSGIWRCFYKSGRLEKEEYHHKGRLIKKIKFDQDGDVVEIEEFRGIDLWGENFVKVSFHKNGNIKTIFDAEGGGAVSISFDENGEYEGDWDYSGMKDHFDNIVLSKDIESSFYQKIRILIHILQIIR